MTNLIGECIKTFKAHYSLSWHELEVLTGIGHRTLQNLVKRPPAKHPKRWPQIVQFFGHQILNGPDQPGPKYPGTDDPALERLLEMSMADAIRKYSPTLTMDSPEQKEELDRQKEENAALREQRDSLEAKLKNAEKTAKDLEMELSRARRLLEGTKALEAEVKALRKDTRELTKTVADLEKANAKQKKLIAVYQEEL